MRGLVKGRETKIDECKHLDNSNLILKNIGAQNFKREEENLYRSFKTGFDHFVCHFPLYKVGNRKPNKLKPSMKFLMNI